MAPRAKPKIMKGATQMKIKIALATATAMGLAMGAAWAGSTNTTKIEQTGDYNQASVDQSEGSGNKAGDTSQSLRQVRNEINPSAGLSNSLTIVQSGDDNTVGLGTNANGFGAHGIYQEIGYAHDVNPNRSGQNVMTITQESDDNTVGSASQYSKTHRDGNTLTILQRGAGGHTIGSVSQYRDQTTLNVADIDQAGQGNTIARIQQYANRAGDGVMNLIDVEMTGDDNGNDPWTPGGAAEASGAISSALIQGGQSLTNHSRGGSIMLDIRGHDNEFGVSQYGFTNAVGILTITGDDNELGVYQNGDNNDLSLSTISGMGNQLGLRQVGDYNLASIDIGGSYNGGGFFTSLSPAASVAGSRPSGLIEQISPDGTLMSERNSIELAIVTDLNQFSLHQNGQENSINGAINTGNANQVAVAQVGDANAANFTQAGQGNNIGINQ